MGLIWGDFEIAGVARTDALADDSSCKPGEALQKLRGCSFQIFGDAFSVVILPNREAEQKLRIRFQEHQLPDYIFVSLQVVHASDARRWCAAVMLQDALMRLFNWKNFAYQEGHI